MNKTLLMLAGCGAAFAAPAHAIDFRNIAPENTSTIVVVENFTTFQQHLETSGLKAAWDDERVQEWFETFSTDMLEEYGEELENLGLKIEDMKMPEGQVGMAVWMDEADPDADEMPDSHTLLVADFGGNADAMHDMLREALDRAAADGRIRFEEDEYGDYEIMTVLPAEEEDAEDGEEDWEDWDEWDGGGGFGGPFASLFPGGNDFEEMHIARAGDVFFVCTTLTGLEDALDRNDGDGDDAIGHNDTFVDARRRLGEVDAWFVGIYEEAIAEMLAADAGMPTGLADLGIEQVKSLCLGADLDSPRAMMELTGFLLSDGKDGMLSLIDLDSKPFAPPAFVGPDATEVITAQFSYERLMDMVQKAMKAAMEEEQGGGMAAMMEQQLKMIEPAVRAMGPDTWMAKSIRRPFSADSEISLTAIRVRDAQTVAGVIDNVGAMFGLESRDFQGNQIWSMGDGGMIPLNFAVGIGGGYMFVSQSAEVVENALRQNAQADALAITEDEGFKKASSLIQQKGVIYGFSNVKRQLPYLKWLGENMGDVIRQQWRDQMGGGELEEWQEEMINDMAAAAEEAPPMEVLFEYIGNMIYEVRSVEEGYAARAWILRP